MRRRGLVIAIDGPSGAGKSTLTRLLADRLGYVHIDTGAMYRTLALAVSRAGVSPEDEAAVAAVCRGVKIDFLRDDGCCRVTANGEDVSAAIRTPEISMLTSKISALSSVREILLVLQRELGRDGGVILEGRDIGTVVFPDAFLKVYLTAPAGERAERRARELEARGESVDRGRLLRDIEERDRNDSNREHAPLKAAEDSVAVDTTGMRIDDVVEALARLAAQALPGQRGAADS